MNLDPGRGDKEAGGTGVRGVTGLTGATGATWMTEEKEKKFLLANGPTGQSKVVQEVLADLQKITMIGSIFNPCPGYNR